MPLDTELLFNHLNRNPPETLYHYTSLEALRSIVESGRLWASNLRYLNDVSERTMLLRTIQARVRELAAARGVEGHQNSYTYLTSLIEDDLRRNSYIASFTEKRDDLSQWRAYCPPGQGVCIGFKSDSILKALPSRDLPHDIADLAGLVESVINQGIPQIAKVIYIDQDSGPTFDNALLRMLEDETLPPLPSLPGYDTASMTLFGMFGVLAPYYKSAAFREESEWRIVIGDSVQMIAENMKFRSGSSTLIPYTELPLSGSGDDYLSEVLIGPSPNSELTVDAVELFLRSRKAAHVPVRATAVPFRHW